MIIPNAEHAIVDIRKLRDYVLDPTHERGKHKARVFAATFDLTANDAEALQEYLLGIVQTHEAQTAVEGDYGQIYRIDLPFAWNDITENVRITWIIRHDEDFPRLVSCFVRRKGR
ncbi:MAG: hypothetical protein HND44_12860 [Chloroflexi bacterium]|nr:hypothetical protein [Ardenticatenaceae bacterium]MBL1129369.1 hypothetical protein [Chloroflexota bacterium]NOG35448.1 hypothetical protein [Chloroflexota bacterium]GIK55307.1 MAG: hypothetical protein BroJett015_09700 [Chloroflexota bacterium]